MKLQTYVFSWGVDGTMYDPAWPTLRVRARTPEEAKIKAQAKLAKLLYQEGRPYWENHGQGWVKVPRREVKGSLLWEGTVVPWKRKKLKLSTESFLPMKIGNTVYDQELLAAFMSAPILQVIDKAPVIANLFDSAAHSSDALPSIPMSLVSYSRKRPT